MFGSLCYIVFSHLSEGRYGACEVRRVRRILRERDLVEVEVGRNEFSVESLRTVGVTLLKEGQGEGTVRVRGNETRGEGKRSMTIH